MINYMKITQKRNNAMSMLKMQGWRGRGRESTF
jgi:hypothetical protein